VAHELGIKEVSSENRDYFVIFLTISQLSEWYAVAPKRVKKVKGGEALFRKHETLETMLKVAYPDYQWQHDQFLFADSDKKRHPRGYWQNKMEQNKEHLFKALDRAEKILGLTQV